MNHTLTSKITKAIEKTFPPKKRICILDELRGLAVIAMILYHTIYSMAFIGNYSFAYNWLITAYPYQPLIPITFISICGVCSVFSRSNLKNGIKLLLIALIATLVTAIALPSNFIIFGILHFLGCSLIIISLFKNLINRIQSTKVICAIIIFCLIIYTVCFNIPKGYIGLSTDICIMLPQQLYSYYPLFIIGLPTPEFFSADYFPLFPHIFLFIVGVFVGKLISKIDLPNFMYRQWLPPLDFIGRHALIIYILHQPLIIGVIYAVKAFL